MNINNSLETNTSIIQNKGLSFSEICDLISNNTIMCHCPGIIKYSFSVNNVLSMLRAEDSKIGGILTVVRAKWKKNLKDINKRLLDIQASGAAYQNVLICQPCKDEIMDWVIPLIELNTDSSVINLSSNEQISVHRIGYNSLFSTFVVDNYAEKKFWGNYFFEDTILSYKERYYEDEKLYERLENLIITDPHKYGEPVIRINKSLKLPVDKTNYMGWIKEYKQRFCLTKVSLKEEIGKPIQRSLLL